MFKLVLEKAEEQTRDQIANIRWIIEKAREFQKNIYFCFIDYFKAFDCMDHKYKNVIIAYEPVWAIGTGVTATADQADEGNGYVREAVAEAFGKGAAEQITVQYGGSMNDGNAAELLSKENVDGGLIGGASLKTDKFTAIVKAANA